MPWPRVTERSAGARGTGTPDLPRERLVRLGGRALTSRELLALLVGGGSGGASALDVADGLLQLGQGSPGELARLSVARLTHAHGVGEALACRLAAAFELGRRAHSERASRDAPVRGPRDVFERLGPHLRDLVQEEFHALLLNAQHRIVREVLVTKGILDASLIHPREVFRIAVVEGAAGVILVHNHPSGDPSPSPEDRAVTQQLADSGRTLGIPVLDHVIIGDGRFVSLAERGFLEPPRAGR